MAGIDKANGHRPEGVLDLLHPALIGAEKPDPADLPYDLERALGAVFKLHADVPATARTAMTLGTEREGNGILIDDEGLVITIGYLITEADEIRLTDVNGQTFEAQPVGYDHETGIGLVRAVGDTGATPLPIGDSAAVSVEDHAVIASFGGHKHAVSARVVAVREFAGSWEYMLDEAICTVPVHPYWGGAALLDATGALVGVGSLYVEHSVDDGSPIPGNLFVPINLLAPIREAMVRTGRAERAPRAWLGAYVEEVDDRLMITGVAPNGPGDQAGLQPGDLVLSLEGVAVSDLPDYYRTLWASGAPGGEVRFTILRDDDVLTVRAKTGDRYDWLNLPRPH